MNTRIHLLAVAAASTLALGGCATTSPGYGYGNAPAPVAGGTTCYDCGSVVAIEPIGGTPSSGATGAVVGGLLGAAAGRELADDRSTGRRNTATVAGAAAGAVAGAAVQRRVSDGTGYRLTVRMNDGRTTVVTQDDLGGIRQGSYVRVYNGRAWPAR